MHEKWKAITSANLNYAPRTQPCEWFDRNLTKKQFSSIEFQIQCFQRAILTARWIATRMAPEHVTVVSTDMAWQQTTRVQVFYECIACLARNFSQIYILTYLENSISMNGLRWLINNVHLWMGSSIYRITNPQWFVFVNSLVQYNSFSMVRVCKYIQIVIHCDKHCFKAVCSGKWIESEVHKFKLLS